MQPEAGQGSRIAETRPLHRLLSWIVTRVRPGRPYPIHPDISTRSLLEIFTMRGVMLLRGYLRRPLLGSARGFLFLGRNVSIRHAHLLRTGRGVVLDDNVFVDALGQWGVRLDDGVTVARGCVIRSSSVLWTSSKGFVMGKNSSLGEYSFVGAAGGVRIGSNVLGGQRLSFHSENHNYEDATRPIREQGVRREGIVVEDDCWLGSGAIFLDGVRVGRGSVVAAGSVVTRSVPAYSIVAGVPAKVIGERGRKQAKG
ncbi:MAG: acyltransferase [Chloroflexota bacterium]|nr:acyltransferase [Chloroflexota bacterium]MDQ5865497.1 acyltransferase [Chloroflexota bacterium]